MAHYRLANSYPLSPPTHICLFDFRCSTSTTTIYVTRKKEKKKMFASCNIYTCPISNPSYSTAKCKLSTVQAKNKSKKKAKEIASLGFGKPRKDNEIWKCAARCGACCKLDKGLTFPAPEEIFDDDPINLQLFKSIVGPDGWCIHYEHTTRTCSIYEDRPSFCRVKPDVFEKLYGIPERRFNKEACSSCKDTITAVYGSGSEELNNFNRAIRSNSQS